MSPPPPTRQSVLPFFVATKMSNIRRATLTVPTPERYVSSALSTVGLETQTNGYWPHALMVRPQQELLPANTLRCICSPCSLKAPPRVCMQVFSGAAGVALA